MAATEANLWQWLRKARSLGESLVMRRVENLVSTGDGDVDGILAGAPFDIELKAGHRPKRPTTVIRHEPVKLGQVLYAEAVLKAGGAASFLIGVGAARERRFYVVHGALGRWLMPFRTEKELASFGVEVYTPVEAISVATHMKGAPSEY